MTQSIDERIASLGLDLGDPIPPLGSYAGAVVHDGLVYTSGVVGLRSPDWHLLYPGRFGADLPPDDAYQSARTAMISTLANIRGALGGSLNGLLRAIHVTGYIQTEPSVMGLPALMNGATDLLVEIFGEELRPARTAVGVYALPGGASVELECLFAVAGP